MQETFNLLFHSHVSLVGITIFERKIDVKMDFRRNFYSYNRFELSGCFVVNINTLV